MKSLIILTITTLLAAATAADFKTTTKNPTPTPPLCKFDPVKGEYICPEVSYTVATSPSPSLPPSVDVADADAGNTGTNVNVNAGSNVNAVAADCPKCQADWEKCLTHWGCWFYNCGPACHCQVANNDPQCKECPAGECHASGSDRGESERGGSIWSWIRSS